MPPRQRNARGEGAKLREELLAGAQRILERGGSEDDVTLRAVAREVGVSAPSIYAHFADGRAIVDALVQQTFAQLSAVLQQARDDAAPSDRLAAICKAYVQFGVDQPERYLTMFERRRSVERTKQIASDGRPFLYPNGAEAFAVLSDALAEARGGAVDNHAAALLWAAMHGYLTLRSATPGFPYFADADETCAELVTRFT